MKAINKKYLTVVALIWVACFIVHFFIYMLLLAPQGKSMKQIGNQLAMMEQDYNAALKVTQEETKTRLDKEIEDLRNKLKVLAIDFEDSANTTLDISQIANEQQISSFSIKNTDKDGVSAIAGCSRIGEQHIDISFTSEFNEFATLLSALERHLPIIFVDRFAIVRSRREGSGHRVNMSLSVFVRK